MLAKQLSHSDTAANPAVGNWRNDGPEMLNGAQIEWTPCSSKIH